MMQSLPLVDRLLSEKERARVEYLRHDRDSEMRDLGIVRTQDQSTLGDLQVLLARRVIFWALTSLGQILTLALLYGFIRVRRDNIPPDVVVGVGISLVIASLVWLLCWACAVQATPRWKTAVAAFFFSPISCFGHWQDLQLIRHAITLGLN